MWLVVELTDRQELYDFRLTSGVVRDDDGVMLFLGIIDGDRDVGREWESRGGGGAFVTWAML